MPKYYKIMTYFMIIGLVIVLGFCDQAYSKDKTKAEELAKKVARQKRLEQEENEIIVSGRVQRGIYFYKKGNYQEAMQQLRLALELSPEHKVANDYLNSTLDKIHQESAKHYARGKKYYNKGRMQKAVDELSKVAPGTAYYNQAQEYLMNAKEILEGGKEFGIESSKLGSKQVKEKIKEMSQEEKLVILRKKATEDKMMLEVESAYIPPERFKELEEEAGETEEEIAERLREQEQEKLVNKMNENIVPALSLSDADVRDVIRELVKLTGVNIILDEGALKEVSGEEALTVSFTTVTPMPLLDLLDIALKTTALAYKVEATYIWISDKKTISEEKLVTKTYRLKYGVRTTREVSLVEFGEEEEEEEEF